MVVPVVLAASDLAAAQVGVVAQDKAQAVQARAKDMDAAHRRPPLPPLPPQPRRMRRPLNRQELLITPKEKNLTYGTVAQ